MYCDLECEGQHLLLLNLFAWGLNMLPFLPCQKTVKKDGIAFLDCYTKKYISCQRCPGLGHSTSKIDIKKGTGKTIKCFQAEWSLHIKSVKYFLPICNISSDSIEKAPWFRSSPFYLWHGTYFIILHKILLGLVYLKTSSGIGFNGLWCCWKKWGNSGKYEKNLNLSAPGGPYTPMILGIHRKYLWKSIKHLIICKLGRSIIGNNGTHYYPL